MRRLVAALLLLIAGLTLMYWDWQPRGREQGLALGMFLVLLAVPLLLPISGASKSRSNVASERLRRNILIVDDQDVRGALHEENIDEPARTGSANVCPSIAGSGFDKLCHKIPWL